MAVCVITLTWCNTVCRKGHRLTEILLIWYLGLQIIVFLTFKKWGVQVQKFHEFVARLIVPLAGVLILTSCQQKDTSETAKSTVSEEQIYEMTWKYSHRPLRYFEKAAKEFKQKVEAQSDGKLVVNIEAKEIASAQESSDKTKNVLNELSSGETQMAQIFTSYMPWEAKQKSFWVFDLPYLFEDHKHFDRFADSRVGKELLKSVSENSDFQALAYTYSGGFLSLFTKGAYSSESDLILNIWESPVWNEYFSQYGVTLVQSAQAGGKKLDLADYFEKGIVNSLYTSATDGLELLFEGGKLGMKAPSHLYLDDKFMLSTVLLVNKDFYESLPTELQEVVTNVATEVAKSEREYVVAEAKKSVSLLEDEHGVKIVRPVVKEHEKIRSTEATYKKFYDMSEDHESIVKRIRELSHSREPVKVSKQ